MILIMITLHNEVNKCYIFYIFVAVDETTTDIICIKCKRDNSESPNEIVLCDKCGIGMNFGVSNSF